MSGFNRGRCCRVTYLWVHPSFPSIDPLRWFTLIHRVRRARQVFDKLCRIVPHLPERLLEVEPCDIVEMAELVCFFCLNDSKPTSHSSKIQKGISSARSDDTKGLKGVVLDWITERGSALNPPLSRNIKTNQGFHHPVTGRLLCPAGLDWEDKEWVCLCLSIYVTYWCESGCKRNFAAVK